MDEKKFVGRNRELEDFDKFLNGERPNWGGRGKGAPLLLLVGDVGMGKSALLREMVWRAYNQKHYVIPGEVDKRKRDFREQIYPLVARLNAMVRKKKRLPLLKEIDWLKVGLGLLDKVVPIKDFVLEIRKVHQDAGNDDDSLALLFHSALKELDGKTKDDAQRIIILLDPEKESPEALIPLLRDISRRGLPPKVRFVIAQAQRPKDAIIEAVEHRELRELCTEPMYLDRMGEKDSLKFIEVYDTHRRLNEATRKVFLESYGGWPLPMGLALRDLQEVKGEVTEKEIKSPPLDIIDIWKERYDKVDSDGPSAFLDTVCLLPHRYPKDRVAGFANLNLSQLRSAWKDPNPIWQLLEKQDCEGIHSGKNFGKECSSPQHATAREYVLERLKVEGAYPDRLDAIVSHYKDIIRDKGADDVDKRDALVHLLSLMIDEQLWDEVEKLLTNINYLKEMQSPEEQYIFQKDFIDLLNNQEIPINKLVDTLEGVLNAVCEQLETGNLETEEQLKIGKQKADWLDTFAYCINEFGPKDDSERSLKLKDIARRFDNECGKVSKELAKIYLEKGKNDWALRFAELRTWVCQRAGDYEKCADACQDAEKMCLQEGMDDAYRYLGQAEFVRMRAHALTTLSKKVTDKNKREEYEAKAHEAYKKLNDVFPAEGGESRWPTIKEWKELEELLETNTDEVLTPPSQTRSDETFRAKVVSNLDDCISAMHLIQFFEKNGSLVEWIHHENFEPEQFAAEDTLFTVLVGGPKSPGISNVADKFYETDKEGFLRMYSGLHFEANCLKTKEGNCYMLGGISKVNTLMAAYEFTKDAEVMGIINRQGQPLQ